MPRLQFPRFARKAQPASTGPRGLDTLMELLRGVRREEPNLPHLPQLAEEELQVRGVAPLPSSVETDTPTLGFRSPKRFAEGALSLSPAEAAATLQPSAPLAVSPVDRIRVFDATTGEAITGRPRVRARAIGETEMIEATPEIPDRLVRQPLPEGQRELPFFDDSGGRQFERLQRQLELIPGEAATFRPKTPIRYMAELEEIAQDPVRVIRNPMERLESMGRIAEDPRSLDVDPNDLALEPGLSSLSQGGTRRRGGQTVEQRNYERSQGGFDPNKRIQSLIDRLVDPDDLQRIGPETMFGRQLDFTTPFAITQALEGLKEGDPVRLAGGPRAGFDSILGEVRSKRKISEDPLANQLSPEAYTWLRERSGLGKDEFDIHLARLMKRGDLEAVSLLRSEQKALRGAPEPRPSLVDDPSSAQFTPPDIAPINRQHPTRKDWTLQSDRAVPPNVDAPAVQVLTTSEVVAKGFQDLGYQAFAITPQSKSGSGQFARKDVQPSRVGPKNQWGKPSPLTPEAIYGTAEELTNEATRAAARLSEIETKIKSLDAQKPKTPEIKDQLTELRAARREAITAVRRAERLESSRRAAWGEWFGEAQREALINADEVVILGRTRFDGQEPSGVAEVGAPARAPRATADLESKPETATARMAASAAKKLGKKVTITEDAEEIQSILRRSNNKRVAVLVDPQYHSGITGKGPAKRELTTAERREASEKLAGKILNQALVIGRAQLDPSVPTSALARLHNALPFGGEAGYFSATKEKEINAYVKKGYKLLHRPTPTTEKGWWIIGENADTGKALVIGRRGDAPASIHEVPLDRARAKIATAKKTGPWYAGLSREPMTDPRTNLDLPLGRAHSELTPKELTIAARAKSGVDADPAIDRPGSAPSPVDLLPEGEARGLPRKTAMIDDLAARYIRAMDLGDKRAIAALDRAAHEFRQRGFLDFSDMEAVARKVKSWEGSLDPQATGVRRPPRPPELDAEGRLERDFGPTGRLIDSIISPEGAAPRRPTPKRSSAEVAADEELDRLRSRAIFSDIAEESEAKKKLTRTSIPAITAALGAGSAIESKLNEELNEESEWLTAGIRAFPTGSFREAARAVFQDYLFPAINAVRESGKRTGKEAAAKHVEDFARLKTGGAQSEAEALIDPIHQIFWEADDAGIGDPFRRWMDARRGILSWHLAGQHERAYNRAIAAETDPNLRSDLVGELARLQRNMREGEIAPLVEDPVSGVRTSTIEDWINLEREIFSSLDEPQQRMMIDLYENRLQPRLREAILDRSKEFLSTDDYAKFARREYLPLHRDRKAEGPWAPGQKSVEPAWDPGGFTAERQHTFRRFEGSSRPFKEIEQDIVDTIRESTVDINNNGFISTTLRFLSEDPESGVRRLPEKPKTVKEGSQVLPFIEEGQPTYWEVPDSLADVFTGLRAGDMFASDFFKKMKDHRSPIIRALANVASGGIKNVAEMGASAASLPFAAVQAIMDPATAALATPRRAKIRTIAKHIAKSYQEELKKALSEYPGTRQLVGGKRLEYSERSRQARRDNALYSGFSGMSMETRQGRAKYSPLKVFDFIADVVTSPVEHGVKGGTVHALREMGWDPVAAAAEARHFGGSPDFGVTGRFPRFVKPITMFLNPAIQGIEQGITAYTRDPLKALKHFSVLAGLEFGITLMNEAIAPDWADHFTAREMNDNLIIAIPGAGMETLSDGRQRPQHVKILLPHLLRGFKPPSQFVRQWIRNDPQADSVAQMLLDVAENFLPGGAELKTTAPGRSAVNRGISTLGVPFRQGAELALNRNTYSDTPIISRRSEAVMPEEQSRFSTKPSSKAIAASMQRLFGEDSDLASPELWDYLTSTIPGPGEMARDLADLAIGREDQEIPKGTSEKIRSLPLVGALGRRFQGSPVSGRRRAIFDRLYAQHEKSQKVVTTVNRLMQQGRGEDARARLEGSWKEPYQQSRLLAALVRELGAVTRDRESLRTRSKKLGKERVREEMANLLKREEALLKVAEKVVVK